MSGSALLRFFLVIAAVYAALKAPGLVAGKPVPTSLIAMYMAFAVIITLLVMTATARGARELFAPIAALVHDPSKKAVRNIVFALLPLLAGYGAYASSAKDYEPPTELRVIHPAPPNRFKAYGRVYDMATLENPLRKFKAQDPGRHAELVEQGGEIYFKNCFYCHGAGLDGRGHYAAALNPVPLPFVGTDTIAQLKDSYVFWRVVKGAKGLPREGAGEASSMPAWEGFLTEEEVWKVILFIYDFTGNTPR